MRAKLFCVICSIMLVACGEKAPSKTASPEMPATNPISTAQPSNPPAETLKIKGLYIGMNIQDASSAMKSIITQQNLDRFEVMDIRKADDKSCVLMMVKDLKGMIFQNLNPSIEESERKAYAEKQLNAVLDTECSGGQTNASPALAVWAGADGKVNRIHFNNFEEVFDAKGLPVSEFMQKFVSAYSIPEMKPNDDNTGWIYVSPEGIKVEVHAAEIMGKTFLAWIHINKVAGAKEIKQGFN